jgi:F0F1-type ATP synthase assembly protein I
VSQIDVSDEDLIVFIGGIIVGISLGLLTNVWVTSKGNQGTAQWYFIDKL